MFQEWYISIPAVPGKPAVMGTRDIRVQIGTEQVPREETYQEYETQAVIQRELLLNTLKDLNASGGTPTPYAYAEAAAYLLGTNTNISDYLIRYYQSLGNRRIDGTDNYPCNSPLSPTNSYRDYKKPDGTTAIIRWCSDAYRALGRYQAVLHLWCMILLKIEIENYIIKRGEPLEAIASNGSSYSGWSQAPDSTKTDPAASATNYQAPTSITKSSR